MDKPTAKTVEAALAGVRAGLTDAEQLIPEGTAADAGVKTIIALESIIQNALHAYNAHANEPYDLAKLPEEVPYSHIIDTAKLPTATDPAL